MISILWSLLAKIGMMFFSGELKVEVVKEAEVFHGNPDTVDALAEQLRMYYKDAYYLHSAINTSDLARRLDEGQGVDS